MRIRIRGVRGRLKKRPDLRDVFSKWMKNYSPYHGQRMLTFYDDDDTYDSYYGGSSASYGGVSSFFDEGTSDTHTIYFYENIYDEFNPKVFLSLQAFDSFCENHGYKVSKYEAENIVYSEEYYCYLCPFEAELGKTVIRGSDNYDDAVYRYEELVKCIECDV